MSHAIIDIIDGIVDIKSSGDAIIGECIKRLWCNTELVKLLGGNEIAVN